MKISKKLGLLWMLSLMMMSSYGQPTGSVSIDRADAAYHLKRSDSLTGYKQLVAAKQRDIDTLLARIETLKITIEVLNEKDAETVRLYNEQLKLMEEQKNIFQSQLDGYEKLLRKEKRKRFWTGVGGVLGTGLATYLFITK